MIKSITIKRSTGESLEIELADVRRRLASLTRPDLEQTANIKNAVKAHKEREQQILSLQGNE